MKTFTYLLLLVALLGMKGTHSTNHNWTAPQLATLQSLSRANLPPQLTPATALRNTHQH
ncbi:hypothetical protein [Thiothrix subterranea]|uniref:hypothetical protein n=1 Tax=Thiothrix subterranea TaxID=2735563 RepID=UPI00280BE483|nr:hypothetical protein [Thiothrix subterranea]